MFAVSTEFSFYYIAAAFRAFSKHFLHRSKQRLLIVTDTVVGLHQLPHHIFNAIHELLHGVFAFFNQSQRILPICCKLRGFYHIRQNSNELHPVLGGKHLLFLPFHKTVFDQLFNNVSSGGRCAKSFAFHLIAHILCSGTFHRRKQAVLGKMFGRLREMLCYLCLDNWKRHAFRKLRQFLLFLILICFFYPVGTFQCCFKFFPPVLQNRFSGYMKAVTTAGKLCFYRFIQLLFPGCT